MNLLAPRPIWSLLAAGSISLVVGSFVLTAWFNLHPCHLCIFQRLMFMKLSLLFLLAAWLSPRPVATGIGLLSLPISAVGIAVAAYQSWLQAQPPGSVSCMSSEPSLIERLVEWLGQIQPDLFLATGFCEEAELSILGLSLANWALVSFTVFFGASVWALLRGRQVHAR